MGRPSRGWPAGSTRTWRKIRQRVLARDGYTCLLRLPGCTGRADCVHHTVSRAHSGDDERLLVSACTSCNLKVGNPERYDPQPRPRTTW